MIQQLDQSNQQLKAYLYLIFMCSSRLGSRDRSAVGRWGSTRGALPLLQETHPGSFLQPEEWTCNKLHRPPEGASPARSSTQRSTPGIHGPASQKGFFTVRGSKHTDAVGIAFTFQIIFRPTVRSKPNHLASDSLQSDVSDGVSPGGCLVAW